jgi:hypothetical protein
MGFGFIAFYRARGLRAMLSMRPQLRPRGAGGAPRRSGLAWVTMKLVFHHPCCGIPAQETGPARASSGASRPARAPRVNQPLKMYADTRGQTRAPSGRWAAPGTLRRADRRLFDPVSPNKRRERPIMIRVKPARGPRSNATAFA